MKRCIATLAFVLLAGSACRSEPHERPHPDTSQGEEFYDPQGQEAAGAAFEPIHTDRPEDRTPTVTSPPKYPPEPEQPEPERAQPPITSAVPAGE